MTPSPVSREPRAPDLAGAPRRYEELRRFFPGRPQRRLALGVAENTILAWDERRATRIHRQHQERVEVLVWTCEEIRPYLPGDADVGEFLVNKQLVVGYRPPYGIIRVHGRKGAANVVEIVKRTARRAAEDRAKLELEAILTNEPLWQAMSMGLSDTALKRLPAFMEATHALRERTGSSDMLR